MAKPKPQVPGATPPPAADAAPAAPTFEQLRDQKIFEIAELAIEGFKTPGDEPKHFEGERLVLLWCEWMQKPREDLPQCSLLSGLHPPGQP